MSKSRRTEGKKTLLCRVYPLGTPTFHNCGASQPSNPGTNTLPQPPKNCPAPGIPNHIVPGLRRCYHSQNLSSLSQPTGDAVALFLRFWLWQVVLFTKKTTENNPIGVQARPCFFAPDRGPLGTASEPVKKAGPCDTPRSAKIIQERQTRLKVRLILARSCVQGSHFPSANP